MLTIKELCGLMDLTIDPVWIEEIANNLIVCNFIGMVSKEPANQLASDLVSVKRVQEQFQILERFVRLEEGKKVLEIGSGYGLFVGYGRKVLKLEVYGIEPSVDEFNYAYEISVNILKSWGIEGDIIKKSFGEDIPFPEGYFDIIYSSNVLEHVKNPDKVISESLRVLKKGGTLQFVFPNYGSWWEGHYGLIWLPNMPKLLAKIYVRLFGRNPGLIERLQLLNKRQVKRLLKPFQNEIELVSFGTEIWEERLKSLNFSEWSSLKKLKKILLILSKFKFNYALMPLGKFLGWETPIILTLRKAK